MLQMFDLEGPPECEEPSGSVLNRPQNFQPLLVPTKTPGQNGREDHDKDTVREVYDLRVSWF